MLYIPDDVIDKLVAEDVPYIDLTTWVLGIGQYMGEISYFTREDALLCGTEEVLRIMSRLHINVDMSLPSGTEIKAGDVFFKAHGQAENLHMAWKVSQNIFDHCSGIATKTQRMLKRAQAAKPNIDIVTTRKGFPGTKALAIKAIMTGGAFPHRLGISETVLVFKQHINFMGGLAGFMAAIPQFKHKICEKKLIVETTNAEDSLKLCQAGVDGLQFDKFSAALLRELVPQLKAINPQIVLLATGGITEENVAEFAQTGVDALVTTSLYNAKPIDIGVKMQVL